MAPIQLQVPGTGKCSVLLRENERNGTIDEVGNTERANGLHYRVAFANTAHVACDKNSFVLACAVTSAKLHDNTVFDAVYQDVIASFDKVKTVGVDAACKPLGMYKKYKVMAETYPLPTSAP